MERVWPPKPKMFTTWPFMRKVCYSLTKIKISTNTHIRTTCGEMGIKHLAAYRCMKVLRPFEPPCCAHSAFSFCSTWRVCTRSSKPNSRFPFPMLPVSVSYVLHDKTPQNIMALKNYFSLDSGSSLWFH